MILLRVIGIFFVAMAFYSFGAVAGVRVEAKTFRRVCSPGFLDLAIVFLSWLAAFSAYRAGYRTALATMIGAGAGLFAGFTLYRLRKQTTREKTMAGSSGRTIPVPGIESSIPIDLPSDGHNPSGWRTFARQAGRFQSGLLLTVFYFTAILPFGIFVGYFGDPLGLKVPRGESFWKPREGDSQKLEDARGQS